MSEPPSAEPTRQSGAPEQLSDGERGSVPPAPTSVRRAQGNPKVLGALTRLTDLQIGHPWKVLVVALLTLALAGFAASKLKLKTAFGELLPRNKQSVIVADRVNERLPAMSTLTVVVEGSDNQGLERFVDALAPRLRRLPASMVGEVDDGVQQTQQFFKDHPLLYAPTDLVQKIHDDIKDRWDYEIASRAGMWLDDDDIPPAISEESIRKRVDEATGANGEQAKAGKYPDGYYLDESKHIIAILIKTPISSGDLTESAELQRRVRQEIAAVDVSKFDPQAKVELAGNLITGAEAYEQIRGDLAHVGFWGVTLILGVVLLFYMRLRTVVTMAATVGIGAVWTFGLAYLLIGYLNSSTGFLFSIVVGNGINFGIIYMARYLEARRVSPLYDSLLIAHRDTWLSTLTASSAATAAYGSLAVTDFRGFRHFGVIGGTGMLLCWLATYLFMPAILALFEKVWPVRRSYDWVEAVRGYYGRPFAFLVGHWPRAIVVTAGILTVGAVFLTARYLSSDPMEYEMHNIDNDPKLKPSEARRLAGVVDDIVGREGQDGIAIAVDRLDQVLPLQRALEKRRDAAPPGHKPFERVVTIYSLLPSDQDKKIALVKDALSYVERAYQKHFISADERKRVADFVKEDKLQPIGIQDLPSQMAESFTEKDGTRGRLVYLVPTNGRSVWDGHYLIEWADSFRRTQLPDGSVVEGSGRSVIYADMIMAVRDDAPKSLLVSMIATLLIVFVAFRQRGSGLWVMGTVVTGLTWTLAVLAIWKSAWPWDPGGHLVIHGMKLNFLNFVALPITIGLGADYGVNVIQRYRLAGDDNVQKVVVETGGAVILCALTTILGYLALTLSVNQAIRSFGIAAATGEIACVTLAVLVLPSALTWRKARRRRRQAPGSGTTSV